MHRTKPTVVTGKNEIYGTDNGLLSYEQIASLPLELDSLRLADIAQQVDRLRQSGWSAIEIQQGFQNDQTAAS